jgi:hypothetical protein
MARFGFWGMGASALVIAVSVPARASVDVSVFYGQTEDLWSTYHGIQDAKNNVPAIDAILTEKYGTFEEGIAQINVLARGLPFSTSSNLLRTFYIGGGAYALASGSVDNPIIPVLHVDLIVGGALSLGTEGEFDFYPIGTRLGITGGWTKEKRADAFSTDLIDHIAFVSGNLGFVGFDQKFAEPSPGPKTGAAYRAALEMHETFFHSTIPAGSVGLTDQTQDLFAFRWKQSNEWSIPVAIADSSRLGIQFIAGPQPIPVDILPRVWDWAHQLSSFSELGTMAGGGLHLRTLVNPHLLLDIYSGVYAGYFGAGFEWRYHSLSVDLGSWGLEGRSAYHSQGARIWTSRLSLTF